MPYTTRQRQEAPKVAVLVASSCSPSSPLLRLLPLPLHITRPYYSALVPHVSCTFGCCSLQTRTLRPAQDAPDRAAAELRLLEFPDPDSLFLVQLPAVLPVPTGQHPAAAAAAGDDKDAGGVRWWLF